jgi:hypothetical protein
MYPSTPNSPAICLAEKLQESHNFVGVLPLKPAQEKNYGNNVSFSDTVMLPLCTPESFESFLNCVAKFSVAPQFSEYYPRYATRI